MTARETAGDTDAAQVHAALGERRAASCPDCTTASLPERVCARASLETTDRAAELAAAAAARRVRIAELTTTVGHLHAEVAELEASLVDARGDHLELRSAVDALTAAQRAHPGRPGRRARARHGARRAAEATAALEAAASRGGLPVLRRGSPVPALPRCPVGPRGAGPGATAPASQPPRQVLDEPEAWELLTTPEPDVAAADADARGGGRTRERAPTRPRRSRPRRPTAYAGSPTSCDSALADWVPVREQLALATRLSSFAEGKAPDNRLQMRLSAYVLAYRLTQVVAAANARLAGMSDRRYSLEHVGQRGAGERRGGLSLVVCDDWSGESRDPATLVGRRDLRGVPGAGPGPRRRRRARGRAVPTCRPSSSTRASGRSTPRRSTTCSTSSTRSARTAAPSAWSATWPRCETASPPSWSSARRATGSTLRVVV